ncbi:substrate-binding domain-containing protein [bacterium]|nr:substrate-binding domain-containing protein [bacterium]
MLNPSRNLIFASLIALFASSCGGQKELEPTATPIKEYKLAISFSHDDAESQSIRKGAEGEAQRLLGYNKKIDLVFTETPTSAEDQAKALRALQSQGVQGAAVSCLPGDEVKNAIDECVDGGMKVITFQNDSPDSKRSSFFGVQLRYSGGVSTRVLEKELNGQGAIAILADAQSSQETAGLMEGVNQRLASEDNTMSIAKTVYCEGDPERAWQVMAETQSEHPEIRGWLWLGSWPMLAQEPKFELLQGVKIVSLGLSKTTRPFLEQEKIDALIGRDSLSWGSQIVHILMDVVDGEKSFRQINWLRPAVVTQDILKRNRLKME